MFLTIYARSKKYSLSKIFNNKCVYFKEFYLSNRQVFLGKKAKDTVFWLQTNLCTMKTISREGHELAY
jgi:hypothetical protein